MNSPSKFASILKNKPPFAKEKVYDRVFPLQESGTARAQEVVPIFPLGSIILNISWGAKWTPKWLYPPLLSTSKWRWLTKITLEQMVRHKQPSIEINPLGLFVFPAAKSDERVTSYNKNPPVSLRNCHFDPPLWFPKVYNSPTFSPAAIINGEVNLQAGKDYVVLPCTFAANKEGKFNLSVSTEDEKALSHMVLKEIK